MCVKVWYLKSHCRGPVILQKMLLGDVQGALPVWWCDSCGREVFTMGQRLCNRCKQETEEVHANEDENG